jgi:hypothetical protein
MSGISKIIHHIAPEDKTKWHPIWIDCYDSWKTHFPEPEYQHIMWNDESDIDSLVKESYPWAYSAFLKFPLKIQKIDFARLCFLHKFGGIYADMDFIVFSSFYQQLDHSRASIVEHPTEFLNVCRLQNSLMVAPKDSDFFMNVMKIAVERIKNDPISSMIICDRGNYSGPGLVSDVLDMFPNQCAILPNTLFNPIMCYEYDSDIYNQNNCFTKHFGTGKYAPGSETRMSQYIKNNPRTTYRLYTDKINSVVDNLEVIVKRSGSKLEGNLFYKCQLDPNNNGDLIKSNDTNKQINLLNIGIEAKSKICEIGFNAGHSMLLLLIGNTNPSIECSIFDINHHKYTFPCLEYIASIFPSVKFNYITGDSAVTLPNYISNNAGVVGTYDVVHVDGGHYEQLVKQDIYNADMLLSVNGVMIVDDTDISFINNEVDKLLSSGVYIELPILETKQSRHRIIRKIYNQVPKKYSILSSVSKIHR